MRLRMKDLFPKKLMPYLIMAAMFGNCLPKNKDDLDGIDIEKEYELIKQKKSGLSRRLRDRVVSRYEKIRSEE